MALAHFYPDRGDGVVRSRLLALVAGGHTATSLKWAVPNNEAKRPIEESADNNKATEEGGAGKSGGARVDDAKAGAN